MTAARTTAMPVAAGLRAWPLLHWLMVLLLGIQLLTLTQHHHDLAKVDDGCVACELATQFSGSAPTVAAIIIPALLLALRLPGRPVRPPFRQSPLRHLLPLSQAPPTAT
jgi:hypothetical protein